nr:MAG TPA: Replication associated protein [Microviridae sp.]
MCLVYRKIRHVPYENNGGRLFTFAPCGKCEDCRNHSRYAWAWRLTSDVQYFVEKMGYKVGFITLTYDDAHLPRFDPYLDADCLEESPLANEPCFSKKDTESLILYLRKVLHRDVGMKGLLYFLASEYGPATSRPHYHMLIAWPAHCEKKVKIHGHECVYGYDVTAEQMHALIKHYWVEYKQLGFISPKDPEGGESKRSGKEYLPFEVKTLNDCLNTSFYVAKYVTKDLYYMDNLKAKIAEFAESRINELEQFREETLAANGGCVDEVVESIECRIDYWRHTCFDHIFKLESVKNGLPHHRQTKSLGFFGVRSLSDLQKVDLLNRGKWLLGNDKLSMPPMYVRNKLLFKPCYIVDSAGKRLVRQECTEFYVRNFSLIMDKKVSYFDKLFKMMEDSSYWCNSGLSLEDSVFVSNLIKSAPNFGMKLSEAYIYYFGVPPEHCYQDKKFTLVNRYKHPCLQAPHMAKFDGDVWKSIQSFFVQVLEYCKWEVSSTPDYDFDYIRDLFNQPLTA